MANLHVVPYRKRPEDNDSYCRIRDNQLIVEIENRGPGQALPTRVRVDFRGYGTCKNPKDRNVQEQNTPGLPAPPPGPLPPPPPYPSVQLYFDCPSEDCYDPKCAFDIIIVNGDTDPNTGITKDRYYRGVCLKGPDLVPVPDVNFPITGVYWRRRPAPAPVNEEMVVTIQNQGTADALPARIRVDFGQPSPRPVNPIPPSPHAFGNTNALSPHQSEEVYIPIPPPLQGNAFQATVTADDNKNVSESNEENNIVRDRLCS